LQKSSDLTSIMEEFADATDSVRLRQHRQSVSDSPALVFRWKFQRHQRELVALKKFSSLAHQARTAGGIDSHVIDDEIE